MRALFNILIILGVSTAFAADEKPKARTVLRKRFFQAVVGYHIWHEDVPASTAGVPGDIPMQFHGFEFGGAYQVPFKNFRWVQYYGGTLGVGAAKGAGKGPVLDSVKDQEWISVTVKPGILYRGTAVAEVGMFLPIAYRNTSWQLDDSAQLEINEEAFSVGLGIMFVTRFTPYSSLLTTVTHQHMWNSTVWGIAYQYDFK